jgi:hypothetical protein
MLAGWEASAPDTLARLGEASCAPVRAPPGIAAATKRSSLQSVAAWPNDAQVAHASAARSATRASRRRPIAHFHG